MELCNQATNIQKIIHFINYSEWNSYLKTYLSCFPEEIGELLRSGVLMTARMENTSVMNGMGKEIILRFGKAKVLLANQLFAAKQKYTI